MFWNGPFALAWLFLLTYYVDKSSLGPSSTMIDFFRKFSNWWASRREKEQNDAGGCEIGSGVDSAVDYFATLPNEICFKILGHLQFNENVRIGRVSNLFHALSISAISRTTELEMDHKMLGEISSESFRNLIQMCAMNLKKFSIKYVFYQDDEGRSTERISCSPGSRAELDRIAKLYQPLDVDEFADIFA